MLGLVLGVFRLVWLCGKGHQLSSWRTLLSAMLLVSVAPLVSLRQPSFASEFEGTLNTVSLNFTNAHIDPSMNNQVIRAFVPTGSKSVNCLTSLNESNNAVSGIVVFCGEREPPAFGGTPGILVSVFFPESVPPDLVLSVTLYQQRAGVPILSDAQAHLNCACSRSVSNGYSKPLRGERLKFV